MSVKVSKELGNKAAIAMRDAYCSTLIDLAKNNKDIVLMDADLINALGVKAFVKEFPERSFDCGISEANMIGMACGLSIQGKIPFAHTFGPFASRRVADQTFISGVYNKANVKIIGSDPGVTAASNGGTHMPFEDMGIYRTFPEMTLVEATDPVQLAAILPQIANTYGMFYLRMVRKDVNVVYEEGSTFEIGKAAELRDGKDVTIIASGYCVAEAYKAAEALEKDGISARVVDCFTWKPIDVDMIIKAAKETGAIVTAENHNVMCGLGSAVAEVVVKNCPVPMEMIGSQDEFGEVGPVSYLSERFHMNCPDIVEAAKKVVKRK